MHRHRNADESCRARPRFIKALHGNVYGFGIETGATQKAERHGKPRRLMSKLVTRHQQNREDLEHLTTRMEDLSEKVGILANELQRINERELHEREKFMLRVENVLLRFERLLPPARETKKRK